ncbi:MAG: hypothetical protein HUK26_08235 [Duodenibacillus sp.]|nr:hypothetical protein [Duodenibacillus sp.]
MQITDALTLMQQLTARSAMTIDKHGVLETESGFVAAVRDFFSSRRSIAARNAELNEKMASVLRAGGLGGVAEAFLRRAGDPVQASRARLAVEIMAAITASHLTPRIALQEAEAMIKSLPRSLARLLPRGQRRMCAMTAARMALAAIRAGGAENNLAEARRIARAVMAGIAGSERKVKALGHGYEADARALQPVMDGVAAQVKSQYAAARKDPKKRAETFQDGVCTIFLKDANRRSVRSIGKELTPSNDEGAGAAAQLRAALGDKYARFLPFVSFLACQAGIESPLAFHFGQTDPRAVPNYLLIEEEMSALVSGHGIDIDVRGGKCYVHCEVDYQTRAHMAGGIVLPGDGHPGAAVTGGRYEVEVVIDLEQDMTGKDAPDFTIRGTRRTIPEFARPLEGGAQPPAAMMQGGAMAGFARSASRTLGEDFPVLVAAGQQLVRPVPARLRAAMQQPVDAALLAAELRGLFKACSAGLESLPEARAERLLPFRDIAVAAMIHDVPGLADAVRASRVALVDALSDDADMIGLQTVITNL